MEHSGNQLEKITGEFFAAEPLLEEAKEMAGISFADLDDGKDRTGFLVGALLVTILLFTITAAGTFWFISKNLAEKQAKQGYYSQEISPQKNLQKLNAISLLELDKK